MTPSFSRRLGLATLLSLPLVTTVAACNSSGPGSSPGNEEVATGGERFGTADEETAKLGSDAEPGVFPRTVVHAKGSTEIAAKPERVVVLDTGELDAVITYGITPVASRRPTGRPRSRPTWPTRSTASSRSAPSKNSTWRRSPPWSPT